MSPRSRNRRLVLASRPSRLCGPENFQLVEEDIPQPRSGEILLQTQWLSIEPYMALAMKGSMKTTTQPGADRLLKLCDRYIAGVELGAVMCGPAIGRVVKSLHPEFAEGDLVAAYSGWQEYAVDDCQTSRKICADAIPAPAWLGVLGIPGLTAYVGMRRIGCPQPGETVVISAAMGPVGSLAGQLAKIAGARIVGIASGDDKCHGLVESLGFDTAVNRLHPDFARQLAKACPNGIDVYFENVGGAVWWAAFALLNTFARVPVSGLASQYTQTHRPTSPDRTAELMEKLQLRRLTIRGYAVFDHADLESTFLREVPDWIRDGRIHYREHIVEGLEAAPLALATVLSGRNVGKMLVRVA
jgi:NADPH-dependent curcumin reductase CurA